MTDRQVFWFLKYCNILVSNGTCPKFKRSQTETLSNWNANDALEKYKGKVLLLISGRHEDVMSSLGFRSVVEPNHRPQNKHVDVRTGSMMD